MSYIILKDKMELKKILIIDSEKHVPDLVRLSLSGNNYSFTTCCTTQKALEEYSKEDYDLIITEISFPTNDGYEMIQRIRQSDKEIPILIVSYKNTLIDKFRGINMGADDYIVKPFDPDDLCLKADNLLK